jgi:arsenate reductase (glutaredoxin)
LGLGENSADETVIKALAQHPSLLQRPIVEIGDRAVIARPAEKALDLIAQARA